jgi:hypothetical protein
MQQKPQSKTNKTLKPGHRRKVLARRFDRCPPSLYNLAINLAQSEPKTVELSIMKTIYEPTFTCTIQIQPSRSLTILETRKQLG